MLEEIFSPTGLLSKKLKGYEERAEQTEMAGSVLKAYEEKHIALIEAGTGTGKSLAYLMPAILFATKHKETTVIATNTITLQEQLIEKEIPFIQNKLGFEFKAVLVKGMHNYFCPRRFDELPLKPLDLELWAAKTKDGTRSDIDFPMPNALWEEVRAESDKCLGQKCPHHKECFFFKARKEVQEARILIVNYHLLFSDIGSEKALTILPKFDRLILDEAHNLEEIALDILSKRTDKIRLIKLLNRKWNIPDKCPPKIRSKLEIDLSAERRNLIEEVHSAFQILEGNLPDKELSCRIQKPFPEGVVLLFSNLATHLEKVATSLSLTTKELQEEPGTDFLALELTSTSTKLNEHATLLRAFFTTEAKASGVRWVERTLGNTSLIDTELDIASKLKELIFDRFLTTTLCSATLAAGKSFSFLKQMLGIDQCEKKHTEEIFPSPFDYKTRTLFAIPKDIPEPQDPDFIKAATQKILESVRISQGGAFVLFTSYEMLNECYASLSSQLNLLKQGDASRFHLLEKFKETPNSILFGTDSFWEGVDVPGDALRLVILVKLPFKVPNDPITEAKSELLKKAGKHPFMDYLLPEATLKFKQGFGRLMRRKDDRGCVMCLDKRVMTKGYGKLFLGSLPNCPILFDDSPRVYQAMRRLYATTNPNK